MSLYATPAASFVEALQDEGREVWIAGFDDNGRRALVIDADNDNVSIVSVDAPASLGRWECSKQHYNHHSSLYHALFPNR